ncbi:MAG: hypothetical protein JOY90_31755 [Bradyrhizobium sp.]|uniref:hypothetical protein n=1 Tax=Bradyrhizobium sp. TaxID=376 RepID=UPI001DB9DD31|nr:hypothetical protein [Bradyrhizobium sp.]MBV9564988.1 hypothetical protein [Bradyrhizobium sp.]
MTASSSAAAGERHLTFASATPWATLAVTAIASLSLLASVLRRCRSGFDFTDEGFYVNWISDPWNYSASVSQFGFVYHPLYRLADGDIARLRQINVLLLFALAFALCIVLLRTLRDAQPAARRWHEGSLLGVALIAAATSLSFLEVWLPTPNYNSLNLQAMMLAVIGGLLADRETSMRSVAGWILIGVGGGLAFLAKPPSAAMLGAMLAVYLVLAGKLRPRVATIAVATAVVLIVAAAFAIDGSPSGFVRRIADGLSLSGQLAASEGVIGRLFRLDEFTLFSHQRTAFVSVLVASSVIFGLGLLGSHRARLASALLVLAIAVLGAAGIAGIASPSIFRYDLRPVQFLAVALGVALAARIAAKPAMRVQPEGGWAIIILLLVLPYGFAFGTNNNIWDTAQHAGMFWLLAALAIGVRYSPACGLDWPKLLPVVVLGLLISADMVFVAAQAPYRQTEALDRQAVPLDIAPGRSRLFLSEDAAAYIGGLRRLAAESGFKEGDPVLDLTGARPGLLYAIGARPLAAAWTLGGYPGSADVVVAALGSEACAAIATSWILDAPGSASAIPADVLRPFGIDVSTDYRVAGSVKATAELAPQPSENRLLKPVRGAEEARLACEQARH